MPAAFTINIMSFIIIILSCVTNSQPPLVRVQMEVDEVLGKKSEVTEEDLEKLQFTEQVVLVLAIRSLE